MKIVFDSSTIISLGNSCMFEVLYELKKLNPKIEFYIPNSVKDEAVTEALSTNRFSWSAIKITKLIEDKILTVCDCRDENNFDRIERKANKIFRTKYGHIEILQEGEIDCILMMKNLGADILAIDERTTRLLIEKPSELKTLMEKRYRTQVMYDSKILEEVQNELKNIKIVRSADIVAFAYKIGLFDKYKSNSNLNILSSILYSLKYSGCAITNEEIDSYV